MEKRIILFSFLFLIFVGFVSPLNASIECPEEVEINKEFECLINIEDLDKMVDIRVEIKPEKTYLNLMIDENGGKTRSNKYLLNFADSDIQKKLKILIDKEYFEESEIKLWIRESANNNKKYSSITTIKIFPSESLIENSDEDIHEEEREVSLDENEIPLEEDEERVELTRKETKTETTESVLNLAKPQTIKESSTEKVIYQSKTEVIRKYSIYFFSALLVVIIFLIIKR